MTAKVSPTTCDQNLGQLSSQQNGSTGIKGRNSSKEHHDEVLDEDSEYLRAQLSHEVAWIQKNIKMRCSYMPFDDAEHKIQMDHTQKRFSLPNREMESPSPDLRLNSADYTYTVPTNAFGEIEFVNFGGNIGKFVRVDRETDMNVMLELMMNVWEMKKPNLLISVTGGADNFHINSPLRDVFRRGLIDAARSTGAWIITGGTYGGVVKHVGEVMKEYGRSCESPNDVTTIGIAPWGVIQNRRTLENQQGSWPAGYHIEEHQNPDESFLDPNHSHFILVDNGNKNKCATEICFRARLESSISEIQTDTGDAAVPVPRVLLVLEGGPSTLEMIENALKNNTPAVIVKGSGRAADMLAYAFNNAKMVKVDAKDNQEAGIVTTEKHLSPSLEADIRKQMMSMKFCSDVDVDINIKRIKACLAKSDILNIFEWNPGSAAENMDVAMLKSLLRATRNQLMDQLKLALAWNRIDIVKSEIFTDDKRWTTCNLDNIMLSAIQMNRVNFVELFLDNGVCLKDFLTTERLQLLYNNVPSRSLLRNLFKKLWAKKDPEMCNCNREITLQDVGLLMKDFLGDCYVPHYLSDQKYGVTDKEDLDEYHRSICNKWSKKRQTDEPHHSTKTIPSASNYIAEKQENRCDNPERDLFIWSVLNIQKEMATLFWLRGKGGLAAALLANALLQPMSYQTEDKDLIAQITENSSTFMNLATGVLDECFRKDEKKTQDLLTRYLSHWGEKSCLLIAVKKSNKDFIAHPALQSIFDNIWMGNLANENGSMRLLACIAFPLLIPLLMKFKEKENDELACADRAACNSVQKSKSPHQRGKSLKDSQCCPLAQGTKVDVKSSTTRKKFSYFYQSPMVVFLHNMISYLVFLGLFSYVIISKLEEMVSVEECVLIVWVAAIFFQELVEGLTTAFKKSREKLFEYLTDGLNILDAITLSLFAIGMILRGIPHPQTLEAARVILGVDLVTFFLRLLHICVVQKELGPKLEMIISMVQNLVGFGLILFTFIVAYAISSYAILYPYTELSLDTVFAIFRRPYWNIYGELMLDEIEGAVDCTNDAELYENGTYPRCPTVSGKYVVQVLMGVYMLMCNILLLNLLIAIFSHTFEGVQANADELWCNQRYKLINEYFSRSCVPPLILLPVNVLRIIILIVDMCLQSCQKTNPVQERNEFLKDVSKEHEQELCQFENAAANRFHQRKNLTDQENNNFRVNQLVNKIDELQDAMSERRLENIEKQLQLIIHHLGSKRTTPGVTELGV